MPSPTYVALAKTVLTGSQATITFSTIPSTYTDLVLLCSPRDTAGTSGTYYLRVQPNSATNQMSGRLVEGYGSSSTGSGYTLNDPYMTQLYGVVVNGATANTFGSIEIYIPNYAGSTYKPFSATGVSENNSATASWGIDAVASLYSSTSAISSLTITTAGTSFASGSRFDLYGIKNS